MKIAWNGQTEQIALNRIELQFRTMPGHLNQPRERALKTNRVRKGHKRKDHVSSLCPKS